MTASTPPLSVTPGRALILAGLLPEDHLPKRAEKAAASLITRGNFPFPLLPFRGTKRKYVVRVCDIESTLSEMAGSASAMLTSNATITTGKRPRGRPRKSAPGSNNAGAQ